MITLIAIILGGIIFFGLLGWIIKLLVLIFGFLLEGCAEVLRIVIWVIIIFIVIGALA